MAIKEESLRILLLAPVHREYNSRFQKKIYGIPESQGQASWISAFLKLGHKVAVFRYTDSVIIPNSFQKPLVNLLEKCAPIFTGRVRRKLEKNYLYNPENFFKSLRFENVATVFKPDIIIISGGITSILPQSIEKIKKTCKSKIFLFSGVNPKTSSTLLERDLIKQRIVDLVIENDKGYAGSWGDMGVKTEVLPISSVDPKKHHRIHLTKKEQKEYGCDVCFVGSITDDRIKKLQHFAKFDFKFWGDIKPGVEIPKALQAFYQGTAHGDKMIKIFNASKIVLNFQPQDMKSGGNMRTFEISGSGAFQLADRVDSSWFTDKKDIVLFSNVIDAVRKLDYYLKHDTVRRQIAERGFKRAHREHTYVLHFKKIFT